MSILQTIKEQFKEWNNPGVNVPLANDNGKPSMTLLFAYISFIATILSLIYIHIFPDRIMPTLVSILFWTISLVLYKMRQVDKLKFDLEKRSLEIEDTVEKGQE